MVRERQGRKMIYENYNDFISEVTDRVVNYENLYQEAMGEDREGLYYLCQSVLDDIPQSCNLDDWEYEIVINKAVEYLEGLQDEY